MRRSKSRGSFRRRSRCSSLTACSIVWGKRSRRRKLSAVSSQLSVVSSQFSVLSSQFSVLSSQFSRAVLPEAQSAKILKAVLSLVVGQLERQIAPAAKAALILRQLRHG